MMLHKFEPSPKFTMCKPHALQHSILLFNSFIGWRQSKLSIVQAQITIYHDSCMHT
uniref:Uncharacterized protein n=1 Tax=Rhizophora mucronata TaxID=61149 RepID=A0A2P2NIG5_RHIMU